METLAKKYLDEFEDVVDLFSLGDRRFDLDYPELYERRNSEWVAVPHTFDDVYDLLGFYAGRHALTKAVDTDIDGFVLLSCGWASPLNEDGEVDGRPSEHPERVRVSLVYVAGCDGSLNASMRLADGRTIDGEGGVGALYEAIETACASVWKKEWVRGFFFRYLDFREDLSRRQLEGGDVSDSDTIQTWYAHRLQKLLAIFGMDAEELSGLADDLQAFTNGDSLPSSNSNY